LSFGQVEVERANAAFDAGGKHYAEGSYVVRMQQPYSSYAKTLLERQYYPDLRLYPGGPPQRPYDVTAQTLPLLLGVSTDTIEKPFTAATNPAATFEFDLSAPRPAEAGLAASDIDSWRTVNKIWSTGASVWRDTATGNFFERRPASGNTVEIKQPRVGLYKSYMPAMDEGWTRWLLENFGFAFRNVTNPEIAAGGLRQQYDVLVFPDQPAVQISQGFEPGSMPDEYIGGLDAKAAANLKKFADDGGTVVFLNHSSEFALDALGVNEKNVVRGVSNQNFYSPGSLLNVSLDTHDPLTYGLPEEIAIWSEGSPAWEPPPGSKDRVVARYPKDHVLASGWLLGEKYLENRAALLVVPSGEGQLVLFGMRPQFRAQSYQAFKLFFNSLVLNPVRK
ncbi:MAG TPA: hypothetical protein VGV35_21910, partial [Bryobacteraceae bacterium]|nr:hypothetical protein [Bryobacteraceae bacterium]